MFTALAPLAMSLLFVSAMADEGFRPVLIPFEEHGYSNFQTTVLHNEKEWRVFLSTHSTEKGMGWNERRRFIKAVEAAKVNFEYEALVIMRHTEGRISTRVAFNPVGLNDRTLHCKIERQETEAGLTAIGFYGFVLAVDKRAVDKIILDVGQLNTQEIWVSSNPK